MADGSKIEWTDATWNPVTGCGVISPGCANCYAMKLAGTRMQHHWSRKGLTEPSKAGPVWNGQVRFNEEWLSQPLAWKRPRRIFVCAHGDLFHEAVPDEWIDKVFAVMALAPQHTFQVLTKRADRMRAYMRDFVDGDRHVFGEARDLRPDVKLDELLEECAGDGAIAPLPNVELGVSAEDQVRAEERIPLLLETPAAVRFLSAEPLIGPIDLTEIWAGPPRAVGSVLWQSLRPGGLDWVIVGGESGAGARPMHPDWVRAIRDDCARARVPFFFKQWGMWAPVRSELIPTPRDHQGWVHIDSGALKRVRVEADLDALEREERKAGRPLYGHVLHVGKKAAGRALDGVIHDAMPDIR